MASKTRELRDLADDELVQRLSETEGELFNLRFQHVTGQLDNHARLGQLRKEVARLHTVLREREIAAAEALEAESGNQASAAESGNQASAAESGDQASAAESGSREDRSS
jgi:large subunit ribosomal protein L29